MTINDAHTILNDLTSLATALGALGALWLKLRKPKGAKEGSED